MRKLDQWRRLAVASAVVVGLAVLVAACGSSSSTSSSGSTAPGRETEASTSGGSSTAGAEAAEKAVAKYEQLTTTFEPPGPPIEAKPLLQGKTVWFVPIFFASGFFETEAHALEEALKPLGATLKTCDAKANPTTTSSCFSQAASSGAAGIIAASIPIEFAEQAYMEAVGKGIPVVQGENVIPPPKTSDFESHLTGIDFGTELIGRLEADTIIADSKGKAKVLFANDTTTVSTTTQGKGIENEFAENCPECEVNEMSFQDTSLQNVPTEVQAALTQDAESEYVITQYDTPSGLSVAQGAHQANSDIKFVASGGQLPSPTNVLHGTQLSDVGTDPVSTGWASVDALLRLTAGEPGDGSNYQILHRVFTKKNIGEIADELTPAGWQSGNWYSNGAYKKGYLELWGVS